jgi:hypothetical protein
VSGGRSPVVLQLAETNLRRHNRLAELTRLCGGQVTIVSETVVRDPDGVASEVCRLGAIAVLADSFRGDLAALRLAVAPVPVLRPLRQRRSGSHAGRLEDEFRGYGRLEEDGRVDPLPDGALVP